MEKLWYKNPKELIDNKKIKNIIPDSSMNETEKINSLARIGVGLIIISLLSDGNSQFLSLGLCILILSFIFSKPNMEKFTNNETKCRVPTNNNPYMNYTLGEKYKGSQKEACPQTNPEIRDKMLKNYNVVDYPNITDLWKLSTKDRNFYTMPSTTTVNKQNELASWLYGSSGDCKEKGYNCLAYRDNRYHHSRYYR